MNRHLSTLLKTKTEPHDLQTAMRLMALKEDNESLMDFFRRSKDFWSREALAAFLKWQVTCLDGSLDVEELRAIAPAVKYLAKEIEREEAEAFARAIGGTVP